MACVVPGCSHRMGVPSENNSSLSFHRFPTDLEIRKEWMKNINRGEEWNPTQYSRICSAHFEESCFRQGYTRKTLHSHAVPTIFVNHPLSCQPKLTKKRKLIAKYDNDSAATTSSATNYEEQMPRCKPFGKISRKRKCSSRQNIEKAIRAPESIHNPCYTSKVYPEKSFQMGRSTSNENILETFIFYETSGAESQIEETGVKSEQMLECRACLQILNEDCVSYNIFESWTPPWDGMENSIAEDLAKIANVQISESDRHSKILCETCCQLLLSACNFTAIVKRNDEILRQRYREDKTQLNLSNDRLWPKPIQVDKSIAISMCENVDIKKEIVSHEEQYPSANGSYDPSRDDLPHLDIIKIEPEEIIQPQPSQLYAAVYGNKKLDHLNTKESHLTNGNSDSVEFEEKAKNSAKMNDDELILRRKKRDADRARAYRKRKKDLDAMPSTSTVQNDEPASEIIANFLHQKQLNVE